MGLGSGVCVVGGEGGGIELEVGEDESEVGLRERLGMVFVGVWEVIFYWRVRCGRNIEM